MPSKWFGCTCLSRLKVIDYMGPVYHNWPLYDKIMCPREEIGRAAVRVTYDPF